MAVFRVERTRDYTVMSNYHLRDKRLSLKAKGLLSQMLSLPEDWDYTLTGLARINRESKDAIRTAIQELEQCGYIQRHQTFAPNGKFSSNEYVIYERPITPSSENPTTLCGAAAPTEAPVIVEPNDDSPYEPSLEKPSSENPTTGNPSTEKPLSENPTQLNTKEQNKDLQRKDILITDSFHSYEQNRNEPITLEAYEAYRELIRENISCDLLREQLPNDADLIDELTELMTETVCANQATIRIGGETLPHELVKAKFLKLDCEHIRFVLSCLKTNTTKIRNIRQYLLAMLYNAPSTINGYYTARCSHDMHTAENDRQ